MPTQTPLKASDCINKWGVEYYSENIVLDPVIIFVIGIKG